MKRLRDCAPGEVVRFKSREQRLARINPSDLYLRKGSSGYLPVLILDNGSGDIGLRLHAGEILYLDDNLEVRPCAE